jgi:hypothetical protein
MLEGTTADLRRTHAEHILVFVEAEAVLLRNTVVIAFARMAFDAGASRSTP